MPSDTISRCQMCESTFYYVLSTESLANYDTLTHSVSNKYCSNQLNHDTSCVTVNTLVRGLHQHSSSG